MPQPIIAILAHQDALAARACRQLGDRNEAGLVVTTVLARAMNDAGQKSMAEISDALWRDFESALDAKRL